MPVLDQLIRRGWRQRHAVLLRFDFLRNSDSRALHARVAGNNRRLDARSRRYFFHQSSGFSHGGIPGSDALVRSRVGGRGRRLRARSRSSRNSSVCIRAARAPGHRPGAEPNQRRHHRDHGEHRRGGAFGRREHGARASEQDINDRRIWAISHQRINSFFTFLPRCRGRPGASGSSRCAGTRGARKTFARRCSLGQSAA